MSEIGKRLIVKDKEHIEIEEFDVPKPGPGQFLVKVTKSQISAGSEKAAFTQKPGSDGRYLGDTLAGRILALGDGMDGDFF